MKKLLLALVIPNLLLMGEAMGQTIDQALKQVERGSPADAAKQLAQIRQSNPSPEAFFYSGYQAIRAQDLKTARHYFEEGMKLDEKRRPLNKTGIALTTYLEGKTAEAESLFEEVLKESKSKDAEILWRIGEGYTGYTRTTGDVDEPLYKHHNAAKAIEYLDKALKRDKTNGRIWITMGDARALADAGNGGPAVTAYEVAQENLPDASIPKHRIGNVYWAGKNYNLAVDYFKAALAADSLYAPSYLQLAELYFKVNRFKEAAANMESYAHLAENPTTDMKYRSAQFDFLAKNFEQAVSKLEQIKDSVETPVKYRILGRSYFNLEKYEQALLNLNTLQTVAPDKVEGVEYKMMGRAYQNSTDTTIAKDSLALTYLAKAAPTDTTENLYSEMAEMSYRLKKYEDVVKYVETGEKQFNKSSVKDKFWLAMAAYKMGAKDSTMYLKADSAFIAVQETNPNHLPTILYRAKANYYGHADRDTAYAKSIPFYEQFVEMAYANKEETKYKYDMKVALKYLYSYYISVKNDEQKALDYALKGAALEPNDPDFKKILSGAKKVVPTSASKSK
jgi:predicted Zn-dependent protease